MFFEFRAVARVRGCGVSRLLISYPVVMSHDIEHRRAQGEQGLFGRAGAMAPDRLWNVS